MKIKYTYELDSLKRFKYLKPADEGDSPIIEIEKSEFRTIIPGFHGFKNGSIVVIGFTDAEKQEKAKHDSVHRIDELKKLLADSDWKAIVNSELVSQGLSMKYPEILAQRQAWRDEINKLENA